MLTVRLYAERKRWPLDRIEARLTREPAQGAIKTITLDLVLGGALDAEQDRRLREIAERCPVHRTLSAGVEIRHA